MRSLFQERLGEESVPERFEEEPVIGEDEEKEPVLKMMRGGASGAGRRDLS